jgi:hypothetical protein
MMRLRFGAKVKVKIGEEDSEGSCESPVLIFFIMQAAMETLQWPGGVVKPEFKTRESGAAMGENSNRKQDATPFELWASLFADDFALLFNSRGDLITGSNQIFAHLRECDVLKTSMSSARGCGESRFLVGGTGFVESSESFKYLGVIIHYSPTLVADISKRIKSATTRT